MKIKLSLNLKKIPPKIGLRLLPWLTIVALFILLWFTICFMKTYFYDTLTQAEEISILRSTVSLRTINIKLYEQVITALENKKQIDPAKISNLSNPFAKATNESAEPSTTE